MIVDTFSNIDMASVGKGLIKTLVGGIKSMRA